MNITIIHHFGLLGGGTLSCFDIASILSKQGNNVTVAISNPSKKTKEYMVKKQIKYRTDIPSMIELNYHNASRSSIKALVKFYSSKLNKWDWLSFFQKDDSDIIILNSIIQSPLINIVKKCGKKCICFVRETICGENNSYINAKLKNMMNRADAVVFLTEYDKKEWNLSLTKTYVIPDIVDPQKYLVKDIDKEDCYKISFLYLGGLNYVKGALDLLKAFKLLVEQYDCKLYVLGDTYEQFETPSFKMRLLHKKECEFRKCCISLIHEINKVSHDSVSIIGMTNDTSTWYSKSDVVVFPVKNVHQARPVYEAGFFSIPIIVPDYSNFDGIVENGKNGLRYKIDDIHDLYLCMKAFCDNPKLITECGYYNNRKTNKEHSFQVAEKCLCDLLRNII